MAFHGVSYTLYIARIRPLFILIREPASRRGVLSPALGGLRMLDTLGGRRSACWSPSCCGQAGRLTSCANVSPRIFAATGAFCLPRSTLGWERRSCARRNARRQAGLAGNNAGASLPRALKEPRRYPPDQVAVAMAITAAACRHGRAHHAPVPVAMACIACMHPNLQIRAEDVADQIGRKNSGRVLRQSAARPSADRGLDVWSLVPAQRGG